jgi:F420-dependent oxidoreductase-like protein
MATPHRLSFGIKTAPMHSTYEEMLAVWRAADALPVFEHAWLFDHFIPIAGDTSGPCLEGYTLLAAYAAQTERLRVGLMVAGNTYRHPAVVAKMGATLDSIAGGRFDFGIGAGWNELEHNAYGIPLYKPGERIARFAEACEVVRLMWTEDAPDFNGRYYQLQGARCEPKPIQKPHPPFVIGGGGEQKTLRVVAQYADIWNFAGGSVEEFIHKNEVLDGHCAAIGRDPASIVRSVQYRVAPDADLGALREALRKYIEAGATHIIPYLTPPFRVEMVRRLASEVAEPLQAEFSGA